MSEKPQTRSGYPPDLAELAHSTCLYVATVLGDLIEEITVVGGLVPSLLIPSREDASVEVHVGTLDLDLGLAITVFDESRYQEIADRLSGADFAQSTNTKGRPSRQTWSINTPRGQRMSLDFLIPPTLPDDQPGRLRNLEPDFAAIIVPGLHLAFQDRQRVELNGFTIRQERARKSVWVCGAGAFIVLKALAFKNRGTPKDAYDLFYVLKYFGQGVEDVVQRIQPLLQDPHCTQALSILRQDFMEHDATGPMRVAHFLEGAPDDAIQADVVGFVRMFLEQVTR
ncbi:hypothetical protein [Melittangium boletus]|uniref:hypothetical protein n=1 Tax=Melittangium boletus TaxID=83453 RepID=UPI003DA563F0